MQYTACTVSVFVTCDHVIQPHPLSYSMPVLNSVVKLPWLQKHASVIIVVHDLRANGGCDRLMVHDLRANGGCDRLIGA